MSGIKSTVKQNEKQEAESQRIYEPLGAFDEELRTMARLMVHRQARHAGGLQSRFLLCIHRCDGIPGAPKLESRIVVRFRRRNGRWLCQSSGKPTLQFSWPDIRASSSDRSFQSAIIAGH
jgi:hypothetical protein